MSVSGGVGAVGIVFIWLILLILSLLLTLIHGFRIYRARRRGLARPKLSKCMANFIFSPFILLVLLILYFAWGRYQDEKLSEFEAEKDKDRNFTLVEDTSFGGIVLPAGTNIDKSILFGFEYKSSRDLNNVLAIHFPYPVQINGMSVITVYPRAGTLILAEDYHFIEQGKKWNCPKTHYFRVNLNNEDLYRLGDESSEPYPPESFQPNRWTFDECSETIKD